MILYRVNRKFPFQICPCIEMFDFTGVIVPFIVNLSLNGKLLLKIFVFVVWYTRCLSLQPDLDLEIKQSHFDSQLLNSIEQRFLHEKIATKTLLARSIPLIRSFVLAVCMLKVQCDCS